MTLDNEQVIKIAHQHGLSLLPDSLTFNESGLDFRVVFATDTHQNQWVLRFPRREDVLPSTLQEKKTLDLVIDNISVQVPRWEINSNDLIAYRLLRGAPVGTIDPKAGAYIWSIDETNVPDVLNQTLAQAMASLHAVDPDKALAACLSVKNAAEIRQHMKQRMDAVQATFGVQPALWNRWQTWLQDDSMWPQKTGLIHGDLHAGHILIDENAHVTGFIDWTEAAVADTSTDFVAHYFTFGEDNLQKLIHYYEEAGGYVWPKMMEHILELAAAYPIAIAEFALKSGLEEYLLMAREALGN